MSNYQIITDSGCDLPLEMRQQLDVNMVSLPLQFRGKELQDSVGEDITSLYEGLRAGEVASTSAVNPDTWSGSPPRSSRPSRTPWSGRSPPTRSARWSWNG